MATENLIIRRGRRYVLVNVDYDKSQCRIDRKPLPGDRLPGQYFYGGTGPSSIERATREGHALTYSSILALRADQEQCNGFDAPNFRRATEYDR